MPAVLADHRGEQLVSPRGIVRVGLDRGHRGHLAAGVVQRRERVDVPAAHLAEVVDLLADPVGVPDLVLLAGVVRRVRHRVLAPRRTRPGTRRGCGRPRTPASTRPRPGRPARAGPRSGRPGSGRARAPAGPRPARPSRRRAAANAAPAEPWNASLASTDRPGRRPARRRAAAARFRFRGAATTAGRRRRSVDPVEVLPLGQPEKAPAEVRRRSSRRRRSRSRSGRSGARASPAAAAATTAARRGRRPRPPPARSRSTP